MPKRKTKSRKAPAKKKKNMKPMVFLLAAAVVVLIAAVMSMTTENVPAAGNIQQQTQGQGITQSTGSQQCKSNLECFVAICKNNPTVWSCVNAVNQETFYKSCDPDVYTNVITPFRDSSKCACVSGNCQAQ
ncbi:MAG: hypothetical protein V1678_03650 [Candidatus Aenigmatarchaeota archaeon]